MHGQMPPLEQQETEGHRLSLEDQKMFERQNGIVKSVRLAGVAQGP